MKKLLPFLFLPIALTYGQDYGLNENFENETTSLQWSKLDLDGDGKTWHLESAASWTEALQFTGNVFISDSYDADTNQALTPDNVLVSPSFIFESPHVKNGNLSLGIAFRVAAADPVKFAETYAVYMLPANQTFTGNETPLYFETLTSGNSSSRIFVEHFQWETFGKEVKLYFRHYNSANQKALVIDDILNYNYTMSANDLVLKNKTVIFPNPAKRFITVELKNETLQKVEVVDTIGRIYDLPYKDHKVDVQSLKAGIYFMKINTEKSSYINKFIKE